MGNVCNAESHQPQHEIELAPRVAQPQTEPDQARPAPDTDAVPEAPRHENSGIPLQTDTNRNIHHDPTTTTSMQEPREPCRSYAKGYCKHGERCTFLHMSPKEADVEKRSKVLLIQPIVHVHKLTDDYHRMERRATISYESLEEHGSNSAQERLPLKLPCPLTFPPSASAVSQQVAQLNSSKICSGVRV